MFTSLLIGLVFAAAHAALPAAPRTRAAALAVRGGKKRKHYRNEALRAAMAEVHENAYRSSLAAASSIATGSTGALNAIKYWFETRFVPAVAAAAVEAAGPRDDDVGRILFRVRSEPGRAFHGVP